VELLIVVVCGEIRGLEFQDMGFGIEASTAEDCLLSLELLL